VQRAFWGVAIGAVLWVIGQVKLAFLSQGRLDHLGQGQLQELRQVLRGDRLGQLVKELRDVRL